MWPVSLFYFLTNNDIYMYEMQNAKISVMGSGQLSQVMATVSKCVLFRQDVTRLTNI